jgi:hypothetical protein
VAQTELYGQAVSDHWSIYRKFGYYGQGQRSEVRGTDRTTLKYLALQCTHTRLCVHTHVGTLPFGLE